MHKFNLKTFQLKGVNFLAEQERLLDRIIHGHIEETSAHYHLAAVSTFYAAQRNANLIETLNAGVTICDSKPIFKLMTATKRNPFYMRGTDFMRYALLNMPSSTRHYFYGATPAIQDKLKVHIAESYPRVITAGFLSPLMSSNPLDFQADLKAIKNSKPDVVWIALGSPKQDFVAENVAKILNVRAIAVGAAFEFFANPKSEAPKFIRNTGLEWVFRLSREPGRLFLRYLFGNSYFMKVYVFEILIFFRQRFSNKE